MAEAKWAFDLPRNLAVFSTVQVMKEGKPILFVTHDAEDGYWQFLDRDGPDETDAMIVALWRVAQQDPSVLELADLPPGWMAWRAQPGEDWRRRFHSERSGTDDNE